MNIRPTTGTIVMLSVSLLFVAFVASTSASSNHRVKRSLSDVVCSTGTTKISTPFYFRHNSTGWCGIAVGELASDFYNPAYRQECQRWLGTLSLPDSVAQVQLTYCYEFGNGTVQYRVGVCCNGNPNGTRCFTGSQFTQYNDYFYLGHWSYEFDYENNLVTCGDNQVCQTKLTFYGSYGNINNISVEKGCGEPADCSANSQFGIGQCKSCEASVPTPVCTQCCNTPFCNYNDFSNYYMRPGVCPSYPCDSGPCLNGGWCYNDGYNSSLDYYTTYYCRCPPFWNGKHCETNRTCATNVCLNGGTCYDYSEIGAGQYRCNCTPPFVGDRCELKSDLTCKSTDSNSFAPSLFNSDNPRLGNLYYYGFILAGLSTAYLNCTEFALNVKNKPELAYYIPNTETPMNDVICGDQAGRVSTYQVEFEAVTCSVGSITYHSWNKFRSCCNNISRCNLGVNPCLNGGTCYDYSTITPGDNYRCECPQGFVGDKCELKSNLTCSSSSPASIVKPTRSAHFMYSGMSCSAAANFFRMQPQSVQWSYSNFIDEECNYYTKLPALGGHQFRQGVDGQIASDMFEFELTHCSRNDHTSILQFRGCCPGCMSSPCLNGGYCLQVSAAEYVCRCAFGFNGRHCENKLSICAVAGDPHFLTFDRRALDYHGTCKLNLASSVDSSRLNGLPYFNVYSRSINLYNVTSVAYPWYVEIVVNRTTVRLLTDGYSSLQPIYKPVPVIALVNGFPVQIPYSSSTFKVYVDGTTVRCDFAFGLSVTYDGTWVITVNIPTTYAGKMTGICGNADGDPDNDLTLANGTDVRNLPNAFNLFGDSYVVPDPEQKVISLCPAPPQPPPCSLTYSTACSLINSTTGVFSSCISRLSQSVANEIASMCIMDACFTKNASICRSIKAFVDLCASNAVQIPCTAWQSVTGCGVANFCPTGMTYQCSVSACLSSCSDPNASGTCTQPNKDACVCPPGQLLYNGSCTATCPKGCVDANQQIKPVGSSWPGPGCTVVSCQSCQNCTQPTQFITTSACLENEVCLNEKCYPLTTAAPSPSPATSLAARTTKKATTPAPPTPTPKKLVCTSSMKKICKMLALNPVTRKRVIKCTRKPNSCGVRAKKRILQTKICKLYNFCKGT